MARYEHDEIFDDSDYRNRSKGKGIGSNWFLRRLKFDFWNKPIESVGNILLWLFVFFPFFYGLFYGDRIPGSKGFQAGSSSLGGVGNRIFGEVITESKPIVDEYYLDQLNGVDQVIEFNTDSQTTTTEP